MKTIWKYIALIIGLVLLVPLEAQSFIKNTNKDFLSLNVRTENIREFCFDTPYTWEEIERMDKKVLSKQLVEEARRVIPAEILQAEFEKLQFFERQSDKSIFVCFYFNVAEKSEPPRKRVVFLFLVFRYY